VLSAWGRRAARKAPSLVAVDLTDRESDGGQECQIAPKGGGQGSGWSDLLPRGRRHTDEAGRSVSEGRQAARTVADSTFGEDHDGMTVPFQNPLIWCMRVRCSLSRVLEPGHSARLSAIEALRFHSVEPFWRFQVFLEPGKILDQRQLGLGFNLRRITNLLRQAEDAIFDLGVRIPSRKHESNETHG
jgi:hypothetical protein